MPPLRNSTVITSPNGSSLVHQILHVRREYVENNGSRELITMLGQTRLGRDNPIDRLSYLQSNPNAKLLDLN